MKLLQELYQKHTGKVSDKWSIYISQYDDKLNRYQNLPIKLFEVGILNGGSLEIFSKYFSKAELILGCDIDPNCKKLKYDNKKIKVIIGDVNEEKTKSEIVKHSNFDIIIDDGSHNSKDIVRTFCNYFNYLKDGGLFIIEDLHCSYRSQHGGGIFYPISSINFFKQLIDIINYEHWGVEKKKEWLLRDFIKNYKIDFNNLLLDKIHSIEFVNSLCFIKKKIHENNILGRRMVVGKEEIVVPDRKKMNNQNVEKFNESENKWSNKEYLPNEELVLLKQKIEKYDKKNFELEKEIKNSKIK